MKKDCAVVQDLLVLYEDDVLKKESRQMIEEHIETCKECKRVYEKASIPLSDIQEALPDMKEPEEKSEKEREAAAVRAISRFRKKLTFDHMIIAGLFFIALVIITHLIGYFTADGDAGSIFKSMPVEDVKVKEMYQLKNGDIYIVFSSEKDFYISEPVLESPKRHQSTDEAYYYVGFKTYGWLERLQDPDGANEMAYIFPIENEVRDYLADRKIYQWNCGEISSVGAFKNDRKVLWKKGDKVPKAPVQIEEMAIAAYVRDGDLKKAQEIIETNEELKDISFYEAFEKYYSGDESFYRGWWRSRTACPVYEKADGQTE